VRTAIHLEKAYSPRDQRQRNAHLFQGSERIARAVYKKCRCTKARKVLSPKLLRLSRWMERIRKKEQPVRELVIFRCRNRSLAAAIGVAAEKDSVACPMPDCVDRFPQAFAIASRHGGKRRTIRTLLPERQIAAQYRYARSGECGSSSARERIAPAIDSQSRIRLAAGTRAGTPGDTS